MEKAILNSGITVRSLYCKEQDHTGFNMITQIMTRDNKEPVSSDDEENDVEVLLPGFELGFKPPLHYDSPRTLGQSVDLYSRVVSSVVFNYTRKIILLL